LSFRSRSGDNYTFIAHRPNRESDDEPLSRSDSSVRYLLDGDGWNGVTKQVTDAAAIAHVIEAAIVDPRTDHANDALIAAFPHPPHDDGPTHVLSRSAGRSHRNARRSERQLSSRC
jgi:hypothetical protein